MCYLVGILGEFYNNFPGFACWGGFILSELKIQFYTLSVQPGQTCESVFLFGTKMPEELQFVDCILVTMIKIKSMLRLLVAFML